MALSPDLRELSLGGARIRLHELTGTVVSEKTWSETHVTSSGGGGVVGRTGGYVSGPTVASRSHTKRVIWLRDDEGNDKALELTDVRLPVREGHRVSAYWGIREGAASGPYLLVLNHSTGQQEFIHAGCAALTTTKAAQFLGAVSIILLVIVLLPLAVATGAAKWWIAAGSLVAFLAVQLSRSRRKFSDLYACLSQIGASAQR